ncbi:MAG TPA: DsbA family protein [Stellaceae bacterium]|nr:DsbA family protein [Stellaceae bacterium]
MPFRPRRRDLLWAAGGLALGAAAARLLPPGGDELLRALAANPAFLADHPELIERAAAVEGARRDDHESARRRDAMAGTWKSAFHPAYSPQLGTPDAPLLLIEFTDYLCAPCRASAPDIDASVGRARDVRMALMLVPVSGALSDYAAQLAAGCYFTRPPGFAALHAALMRGGEPTQERIDAAAAAAGYDAETVRAATAEPVRLYLDKARRLAEALGLSGVPDFLGESGRLLTGGVSAAMLDDLIAHTREDSNAKENRRA